MPDPRKLAFGNVRPTPSHTDRRQTPSFGRSRPFPPCDFNTIVADYLNPHTINIPGAVSASNEKPPHSFHSHFGNSLKTHSHLAAPRPTSP